LLVPGVSFDFDSFSFHVPSTGLAAYSAPAAKINPKISAMVLVFICASSGHFRKRSMLFLKALPTNQAGMSQRPSDLGLIDAADIS
jgi:hypothetical protein